MANRPKPTALKLIQGNPGKRTLNKSEPKPRKGIPPCPEWLSERAQSAWAAIAPELEAMGILTLADDTALQGLCEAYADWRSASAIVRENGETYTTSTMNGDTSIKPHPAVAMRSDADRRLRAWLTEFGLTPAARAKLSGGKGSDEPKDPWDNF